MTTLLPLKIAGILTRQGIKLTNIFGYGEVPFWMERFNQYQMKARGLTEFQALTLKRVVIEGERIPVGRSVRGSVSAKSLGRLGYLQTDDFGYWCATEIGFVVATYL
jgi:hypothetical protein